MHVAGGSEFRAAHMASELAKSDKLSIWLIPEKTVDARVRDKIPATVSVAAIRETPNQEASLPDRIDHLLVINSDSRNYTTKTFWSKPAMENVIKRARSMSFLFNYIVSPACALPELKEYVADIRIITANRKFYNEISEQSRYSKVRAYPRCQLNSAIELTAGDEKIASRTVRLGVHAVSNADKWNPEWPELINRVNAAVGDKVEWRFMGMPSSVASNLSADNASAKPAFEADVQEFLSKLDVFVFFPSWRREEAWSRSAAEAMMSGCPVITTARGGNVDQVTHGNTGFLCDSISDFVTACVNIVSDDGLRAQLSINARRVARSFTAASVVSKFLSFIE